MKKIIIIIITIIAIAALGYLVWWYDDTRIIERPIDMVLKGKNAFSVKDNGDNVVFTVYDEEIPRRIFTFYFKDGVVDYTTFDKIYENKRWARGGMFEQDNTFFDRKVNKNIVSGKINVNIGKPYEGFSDEIIEVYSKSMTLIE